MRATLRRNPFLFLWTGLMGAAIAATVSSTVGIALVVAIAAVWMVLR